MGAVGPWLDPGFSTETMTEIFSPKSTVEAILEFEAALALALADAEIAPVEEARALADACRRGIDDPESILADAWESGTPLIRIKVAVAESIANEAVSRWLHYGATTQDAVDTARMLQASRALAEIDSALMDAAGQLRRVIVNTRDVPQMGRTFLQVARPLTFGFRACRWLSALLLHVEEVRRARALPAQLGGPVGMPTSYGSSATEVVTGLARRLGLVHPQVAWHVDRSSIRALAATVESSALTASQIAEDLALLASSPIAEVTVRAGGSSSMQEKRNPIDAVRVVAATRVCAGAASILRAPSGHQLDRGVGGWHAEWLALPLLFQSAGAALEALARCLGSLEVNRDRMSALVDRADLKSLTEADSRLINGVLDHHDRLASGE